MSQRTLCAFSVLRLRLVLLAVCWLALCLGGGGSSAFAAGAGGQGTGAAQTIWSSTTVPATADAGADSAVELGVRFHSDTAGLVVGIRFYKGVGNTGTHVGNLWTSTGTLLGTATFAGESASGWQEVDFSPPVAIAANTIYVASYHTNVGHYAINQYYFSSAGVDNPPLHAEASNGVYAYGAASIFPKSSWRATNYWVDVVVTPTIDTTPPTVLLVSPANGATGASLTTSVTATFSEGLAATTVTASTFLLRDAANNQVAASVAYDAVNKVATLTPAAPLNAASTYTATVVGGTANPHVTDIAGNALAANFNWSFGTGGAQPGEGPGGPILVIASATNPFSRYYAEILRAEGLTEFAVADIGNVTAAVLASYDVVIVGEFPLTTAQVTMLTTWVTSGGNLIAMRPDKQLAGLLGLVDLGGTVSNAYLLIDTTVRPGAGLVDQTIQFHGAADLYATSGSTTLGTLYSDALTPTPSPAVTRRAVGAGQAAAFTYDLARSVVYTRQGNPAWSGQERDGQGPIRSDDLFYGAASFDPQPDWIDFGKIAIPQADEQQRLLANLVLTMNVTKKPLPRFWYLPRQATAAVVLTGDDHALGGTAGRFDQHIALSRPGCSADNWECIRSTSYLYRNSPLTDAQAVAYTGLGFEVALHPTTNCANFTASSLNSAFSSQLTTWRAAFPSMPSPSTSRTHCIPWSDYQSQPLVELAYGIRFDTNYYFWPPEWVNNKIGVFTGSGMPMRFAQSDGTMIDVYQATTQMTDESGQLYPATIDSLLDNAIGPLGYYGVFTANMHTDTATTPEDDAVVASAQARGVPVVSALQMLQWVDGRNASQFQGLSWNNGALSFSVSIAAGANGLNVMLPLDGPTGPLGSLTLNGAAVTFSSSTIKGVPYAVFLAAPGTYRAVYQAVPVAGVAPGTLSFDSRMVGTTSAAQPVTLSNTGNAALTIGSISTSGDFSQTNNCGTSVSAGGACTITVTFTPTVAGARTGSLAIASNADGSPHSVTLSGTATTPPTATLSPASLTFASQTVGTTSAAKAVTLSNTGGTALTIGGMTLTGTNAGDFAQTNNCGGSVAAGASCTINVTFTPTAAGARTASIGIADNAAGNPHAIALSGTGVTPPAVTLSPTSLTFTSQTVGTTSAAKAVTLSNTGGTALTIGGMTLTGTNAGDFAQTNNCGTSVAAGANCTINVTFTPTATGTRTASVSITDNAANSPQAFTLSGTGTAPATVTLSPASLTFASQMVGTTSAAKAVTLSNTGGTSLTIGGISLTGTNAGDFAQTNNCGTSVAAGANCTINVTFKPTAAGTRTALLSVTDSGAGSPHTAALSGTGTTSGPALSLSVTSLSFPSQTVGTTSASQSVTFTNVGTATVTFTDGAIVGTNAGDFAWSHNCPDNLVVGANCRVSVTFKPTAAGTRSASLQITSTAAGSPSVISLTGVGAAAPAPVVSLSPTSLAFGTVPRNTTSAAKTVTLTNTGTAALAITSITITGTYASNFAQTNTCGTSVAAGASCTISVTFKPTAAGARTATLRVSDNASGSPQSVSLSGTGS